MRRSLAEGARRATSSSVMTTTASEYTIQTANGSTNWESFAIIGWYEPVQMRGSVITRNRQRMYER